MTRPSLRLFKNYVDAYAHGVATTSDLIEEVSQVAGEDMQWFFDQWVYRAGDPEISTGWTSTELADGSIQVDIRVEQETDELWSFPLTLRWRAGSETVEEQVWIEGGFHHIHLLHGHGAYWSPGGPRR